MRFGFLGSRRRRRDRYPGRAGTSFGAIAQLGERYNGIVEVSGSIPLGSTTRSTAWPFSVKPVPRRVSAGRVTFIWGGVAPQSGFRIAGPAARLASDAIVKTGPSQQGLALLLIRSLLCEFSAELRALQVFFKYEASPSHAYETQRPAEGSGSGPRIRGARRNQRLDGERHQFLKIADAYNRIADVGATPGGGHGA
jgi:hypothetical protein